MWNHEWNDGSSTNGSKGIILEAGEDVEAQVDMEIEMEDHGNKNGSRNKRTRGSRRKKWNEAEEVEGEARKGADLEELEELEKGIRNRKSSRIISKSKSRRSGCAGGGEGNGNGSAGAGAGAGGGGGSKSIDKKRFSVDLSSMYRPI